MGLDKCRYYLYNGSIRGNNNKGKQNEFRINEKRSEGNFRRQGFSGDSKILDKKRAKKTSEKNEKNLEKLLTTVDVYSILRA